MGIISTLDFFTPIVDDPYIFGQIAAANALSDVYAMGGVPVLCLNIVGFPKSLPIEILYEILRGGADKVKEAGAIVTGGHSIQDNEPKYGLSIIGKVLPDRIYKNYGAKPGDKLVLTKKLGVGALIKAIKKEVCSQKGYNDAVESMIILNKYAYEASIGLRINACTDITGFSLLGHGYEMASASKVSLYLDKNSIPIIESSIEYVKDGIIPGGTYTNKKYLVNDVFCDCEDWLENILFEPQTSGGLLFSIEAEDLDKFKKNLEEKHVFYKVIGEVREFKDKFLYVR
ncbi:selenide, water dikinase [Candidatus Arthromitus sp. SFB-rat-Yit]|nr:selenide, water dikinase [Candidatus Arthromitus sp. SFB-rat-Yit]